MKRSERLKQLAEDFGKQLYEKIAEEQGLLKTGEIVDVFVSVAVRLTHPTVSCTISDHNENAVFDDKRLKISVAELGLSVRATNCLENESINTVGDIVQKTADELLEIRTLGETVLNEITTKLAEYGLKIKGE